MVFSFEGTGAVLVTYRLASAFGTSAELWAGMQLQYDLYQAGKIKRPQIERLVAQQVDQL